VPACYRLISKLEVTAAHPNFNRGFNSDDEANRQIGRGEGRGEGRWGWGAVIKKQNNDLILYSF